MTDAHIEHADDQPFPRRDARRQRWPAVMLCAALAVTSYVLAAHAVLTKSPTADEPYHFAAAYTHVFLHDYRIDPEDPPLWSWLMMLPIGRDDLRAAIGTREAQALFERCLADPTAQWAWVDKVMFQSPLVDAPALINRSRLAMAILAPAIVAAACALAWRLAGPVAAVAAGFLLAFDPLLLGHAPLLKNDAAITLATLALAIALVALLRRATISALLALASCCAIAVIVKFSGILLVALAIVVLFVRAVMPDSWRFLGRDLRWRKARLLSSLMTAAFLCACCWLGIWAAYGFRFAATADARPLDEQWFIYQMQGRAFVARHHRSPTDAEARSAPVGRIVPVILFLNRHRLLPNAWNMGFIFMHASSQSRNGYLLGEVRNTGWWYYFPLAMLFKTPTASLVAMISAAVAMVAVPSFRLRRWTTPGEPADQPPRKALVALAALAVLVGGYLLVAMGSDLNLGVRHLMPIYPLLYIATAAVFARAWNVKPGAAAWIGGLLTIALVVESGLAYPNYIAFFNRPSGGARGGVRLLGDSNLDWGQDLPLLAEWQARHPNVKLYLSYFGSVDPSVYGIDYVNIGGGANNPSNRPFGALSEPGVLAVSATQLQGIYLLPSAMKTYAALRPLRPREVLGGTIYLYDYPFTTTRIATSPLKAP